MQSFPSSLDFTITALCLEITSGNTKTENLSLSVSSCRKSQVLLPQG